MKQKRKWERAEIQPVLETAVMSAVIESRIPDDLDHARRICRSLLRIGAKVALERGASLEEFMHLGVEAFLKEGATEFAGVPIIVLDQKAKA